jgi:hypothetical protein
MAASHLLDQSPQQHQEIILWITDQLEPIAGGVPVEEFEGIQRDPWSEQMGPKMKLVGLS